MAWGEQINVKSLMQCLSHPWLEIEGDAGQGVIKTDNLRTYLARRRWQRCGQAILAMQRMSSKEAFPGLSAV